MTPEWGGWLALQAALYIAWAVGIIFIIVVTVNAGSKWLRNRVHEARTMK
jgi:hypothetical protein